MKKLCTVQELAAAKTKGFELTAGEEFIDLVLAYRDGGVHAYRNVCPHVGTPLNWLPDRFLDSEEQYLQCATHGALFRIEDGFCEYGPCAGESLQAVAVAVKEGGIYWIGDVHFKPAPAPS